MFGLSCLSGCCLALSVGAVLFETEARASTPVSIYTAASRVDMLPTDADATEVVIHGAFMFLNATDASYSDAQCGYMYFRCVSGNETMCRMQWQDIRNLGIGAVQCAGFGSMDVASNAMVRTEGSALAGPDTWDLGVGVQQGSFIGGKCAPAKGLACTQPPAADAGAPDLPVSTDAPAPSDVSVSMDTPVSTEDAPAAGDAPVDQSTQPMPDAATGTKDAGTPPKTGKGGGCTIGPAMADLPIGAPGGLVLVAFLVGAVLVRRVR